MTESRLKIQRKPPECPIFGAVKRMKLDVLPTIRNILEDYQWIRLDLRKHPDREPKVTEIISVLVQKITDIWSRASIPTVTVQRITKLLNTYHDEYLKLIRYPASKRGDSYKLKVKEFTDMTTDKLFDIASCKCLDSASCKCSKDRKVPMDEREFLQDQRTVRHMMIGSIDRPKTRTLKLRAQRRDHEAMRLTASTSTATVPKASEDLDQSSDCASMDDGNVAETLPEDSEYKNKDSVKPQSCQQRRRLTTTARASERYGISDRAAADIASSVLADYGIVTTDDKSEVIDRSKLRRERKKLRLELSTEAANSMTSLRGVYFDGRKDKTLVQENIAGKLHRKTIHEEHIILLEEPGSKYLGHVAPERGNADCIKKCMTSFFDENNLNLAQLTAIGCDGTAVNTGHKGGIIRLLESHLNRPLQWFVCLLHGNELPLRHLFEHLDGSTTGPRSFSGPVGAQLQHCETMPKAKFAPIESNLQVLPDSVLQDLSTDQKYLYDICQAITSGICDEALLHRNPGKLVMSRWLTLANRVLRLYIATEIPTNTLLVIANFVVKVYAPVWFSVKCKPSCKDGARHLWMLVNKSRYLADDLKSIIDPVIQRNAYYAHPENLLLSMITDERKQVRELGFRRIMKARQNKQLQKKLRLMQPPNLNFNATDYTELIDWQTCKLTEPPLTMTISDDDLQTLITNADESAFEFPRFPSHTQAVERSIKVVTEASMTVIGQTARDGLVRAKLAARKTMSEFETKSDFAVK